MPMAVATMPPSEIGVSKQRVRPCFFCKPSVTRKTPPKKPTSSPMIRMSGSSDSLTSRAELSAWIIFMVGTSDPQLAPLFDRAPIGVLEDALEHLAHARLGRSQRPHGLAGLHGGADRVVQFGPQGLVTGFVPFAEPDHVLFQPFDRIAKRPFFPLARRPVLAGIVAGRMAGGPIREELDQRRAAVAARPLGRPFGGRPDGQEVVAV